MAFCAGRSPVQFIPVSAEVVQCAQEMSASGLNMDPYGGGGEAAGCSYSVVLYPVGTTYSVNGYHYELQDIIMCIPYFWGHAIWAWDRAHENRVYSTDPVVDADNGPVIFARWNFPGSGIQPGCADWPLSQSPPGDGPIGTVPEWTCPCPIEGDHCPNDAWGKLFPEGAGWGTINAQGWIYADNYNSITLMGAKVYVLPIPHVEFEWNNCTNRVIRYDLLSVLRLNDPTLDMCRDSTLPYPALFRWSSSSPGSYGGLSSGMAAIVGSVDGDSIVFGAAADTIHDVQIPAQNDPAPTLSDLLATAGGNDLSVDEALTYAIQHRRPPPLQHLPGPLTSSLLPKGPACTSLFMQEPPKCGTEEYSITGSICTSEDPPKVAISWKMPGLKNLHITSDNPKLRNMLPANPKNEDGITNNSDLDLAAMQISYAEVTMTGTDSMGVEHVVSMKTEPAPANNIVTLTKSFDAKVDANNNVDATWVIDVQSDHPGDTIHSEIYQDSIKLSSDTFKGPATDQKFNVKSSSGGDITQIFTVGCSKFGYTYKLPTAPANPPTLYGLYPVLTNLWRYDPNSPTPPAPPFIFGDQPPYVTPPYTNVIRFTNAIPPYTNVFRFTNDLPLIPPYTNMFQFTNVVPPYTNVMRFTNDIPPYTNVIQFTNVIPPYTNVIQFTNDLPIIPPYTNVIQFTNVIPPYTNVIQFTNVTPPCTNDVPYTNSIWNPTPLIIELTNNVNGTNPIEFQVIDPRTDEIITNGMFTNPVVWITNTTRDVIVQTRVVDTNVITPITTTPWIHIYVETPQLRIRTWNLCNPDPDQQNAPPLTDLPPVLYNDAMLSITNLVQFHNAAGGEWIQLHADRNIDPADPYTDRWYPNRETLSSYTGNSLPMGVIELVLEGNNMTNMSDGSGYWQAQFSNVTLKDNWYQNPTTDSPVVPVHAPDGVTEAHTRFDVAPSVVQLDNATRVGGVIISADLTVANPTCNTTLKINQLHPVTDTNPGWTNPVTGSPPVQLERVDLGYPTRVDGTRPHYNPTVTNLEISILFIVSPGECGGGQVLINHAITNLIVQSPLPSGGFSNHVYQVGVFDLTNTIQLTETTGNYLVLGASVDGTTLVTNIEIAVSGSVVPSVTGGTLADEGTSGRYRLTADSDMVTLSITSDNPNIRLNAQNPWTSLGLTSALLNTSAITNSMEFATTNLVSIGSCTNIPLCIDVVVRRTGSPPFDIPVSSPSTNNCQDFQSITPIYTR
jgi:hypothetical protein